MRGPRCGRLLGAAAASLALVVGGCAAGGRPPDPPRTPVSGPTPSIPADGVTLQSLGYVNGPAPQFSLPRTAVLQAAVDQTNNVTAVLVEPPPADVAAYLRRTLPGTGFTITADDPAGPALTFTGYGWTGSFTAGGTTAAVLLRPG